MCVLCVCVRFLNKRYLKNDFIQHKSLTLLQHNEYRVYHSRINIK